METHSPAMWPQERTSPELLSPPPFLANGEVKAEPAASDFDPSDKNLSAHCGRGTTLHIFMPLKHYIYYTHTHTHTHTYMPYICLPRWLSGKESTCQCRRCRRHGFNPWVRKIPWKRAWPPTPVFWPGESHGQRSLAGYSPWGHKESDMTEQLSTHHVIYIHTIIA